MAWVTFFVVPCVAAVDESADSLDRYIQAYFQTTDAGDRAKIVPDIRRASQNSIDAVARAIDNVQVWNVPAERTASLTVADDDARESILNVHLPTTYQAEKSYPLLLAFIDRNRPEPFDNSLFHSIQNEFIVVLIPPENLPTLDFNAGPGNANWPRRWLGALRRLCRLDSRRIYLYGSGVAGDQAFLTAVMHADRFAGVVLCDSFLDVPQQRELYPLLIPNLQHTPTLITWRHPDFTASHPVQGRQVATAAFNLMLQQLAMETGSPFIFLPWNDDSPPNIEAALDLLKRSRTSPCEFRSHRFRFPGQGPTGLVRQDGFVPPIWIGQQLEFFVHAPADRSRFTRQVLDSKLALVESRWQGQNLEIVTRKCEAIEVHVPLGCVDFDNRIRIVFNGKRRFDGLLQPSIETLLDSAYTEWEFQNPSAVRLRIGPRGRAIPF